MESLTDRERTEITRANDSGRRPVAFVHGLWLLSSSWDRWRWVFEDAGYTTIAPGWPGPSELKRMWVAPAARGMGLGRRLLAALEQQAITSNPVVRLETNAALEEAIRLYRSSGYVEVPRFNDETYAHHWFEKRLTT